MVSLKIFKVKTIYFLYYMDMQHNVQKIISLIEEAIEENQVDKASAELIISIIENNI